MLMMALSELCRVIAVVWMWPAGPVVRLAHWLSDRAQALDPSSKRIGE